MDTANIVAPGKTVLQITGVLLISLGVFGLLFGVAIWIAISVIEHGMGMLSGFLAGLIPYAVTAAIEKLPMDLNSPSDITGGASIGIATGVVTWLERLLILVMFEGVFSIFIGGMGIVHCRNLQKARMLIAFSIAGLILVLTMLFINFSIIAVFRLVILATFLTGAIKNAKHLKFS